MHTGYFAKIKVYPKDLRLVSIARFNRYFNGEKYLTLAPLPNMLNIKDYETYKKAYHEQVLSKLDPQKVYSDLGENAVLLCYESYQDIKNGKKFCHRHIVAEWLEEHLGIKVEELQ